MKLSVEIHRKSYNADGSHEKGFRHADELAKIAGADLVALIHDRDAPLLRCTEITALPSPVRKRGSFLLEFADGTKLKGRRLKSAEHARKVECLQGESGPGYAKILARRGDAQLQEWVNGVPLASIASISTSTMTRCGQMLGTLHRADFRHLVDAPLPRVMDLWDKLESNADILCQGRQLDAALARGALDLADAHRPKTMTVGIIHKDFSAENIVLDTVDAPICVDNANLALGPCDFDLARTWYLWPMTRADRACFVQGYKEHRSLDTFQEHFSFWAVCALIGSASTRFRSRTHRVQEPIQRLATLLNFVKDWKTGDDHPFWTS
jgi:hypothetical protein